MTPAAIYVRASTESQDYSTDNQAHVLRDYAARHDLEIVRTYSDDGRSGLDLKGRPGLRQLLADTLASPPGFEVLLIYNISRWGRFLDPDESAHYEFVCRRAGVRVIYCAEPFENDGSPIANLLKALKRQAAGDYIRDLSANVARGKRRMAERGFRQGGPRGFGFVRLLVDENGAAKGVLQPGQKKSIQSDRVVCALGPPEEREVVRQIFRMFVSGRLGETEIARRLNAEGAPSPTGRPWSRGSVNFILQDERYIGNLIYGRSATPLKTPAKRVPPNQWTRIEHAIEQTISQRTFAAAQEIVRHRREGWSDDDLLKGLRRVWSRAGTINQPLIRADKTIPCVTYYQRRFGTLGEAYSRVGFRPRKTIRGMPTSVLGADAEIIANMKALLDREGYLNRALITSTPGLPSARWVAVRFGSFAGAYSRIGYEPPQAKPGQSRAALARRTL